MYIKKILFSIALIGLVAAAIFSYFIYTTMFNPNTAFNNESAFDEATSEAGLNNKTVDFSVYVNSERSGSDANNGSFFGGATINKTNYKLGGGAVEFDGTDDYIKVSRDGSLDPGGTNVLTISAWVKRATSTSKTLVAIKRSGGGYVLGVGIHGASTNQIKMTKYGKIDGYL